MGFRYTAAAFAVLSASLAFGDIYMAGDSTMCNYNSRQYPQRGWGQALAQFMKNPDELHNWAVGGRSAKSFKNEGRWQKLVDALRPGDFAIVSFGHNDANRAKAERYSSPEDYKELMAGFINDVRSKGATPILATSIPNVHGFSQTDGNMHVAGGAYGIGPYVATMVELGEEMGVAVIDLNGYAVEALPKLGMDASVGLYMSVAPGECDRFPDWEGDGCHTRDTGAFFYASAAVNLARAMDLPVCGLFKSPEEVVSRPAGESSPSSIQREGDAQ